MTPEDIRNVTFETERKGYRSEDVDDFLQQVADDLARTEAERASALAERDALLAERQSLVAAKEDAESKLYILAEKVEEYRGQEETLKTALINAQRMGETVVHEAKQKAEQMLREATGQSELLRQQAEQETIRERETLESLTGEVSKFKTTILNLYKQHIESLSALDAPVARAEEVLEKDVPAQAADAETETAAVEEVEPAYGNAEPEIPEGAELPEPPRAAPSVPFEGVPLDNE